MWKGPEKDIKPRLTSLMQAQDPGYRPNHRMQFLITDYFSATLPTSSVHAKNG